MRNVAKQKKENKKEVKRNDKKIISFSTHSQKEGEIILVGTVITEGENIFLLDL